MKYFPPKRDFYSLSVKDLLEAREAYHVHLAHLENVVATAIGRFFIRNEDPDATTPYGEPRPRKQAPKRTFQNSAVKLNSWPCVLVFVDHWRTQEEFDQNPDQVVPRFLYLPDGRVVPTCVLLVEKQQEAPPALQNLNFPSDLIGGGYPVLTDVQEQEHVGSLGCLVWDGDTSYALTNRHVTGEEGRGIYSLIRAKRQKIGVSHKKQMGKKPFEEVYPGWPGKRVLANLDAGLIRVDDLHDWTAQVFGIGELGELVDLNTNTISLDLIGCPVRAFGGASGPLLGAIHALFYRYKSVGGIDYVADVLIGPRDEQGKLDTRPGDSGTLWLYDPAPPERPTGEEEKREAEQKAPRLRPLAVQWGGHRLMASGGGPELRFALATFLSTICRELDVDVIRDWNIGHDEYWGKTGHYKIGWAACGLVADPQLKQLLENNRDRIAFDDQSIEEGALERIDPDTFVPLADVPDYVWRKTRRKDNSSHFADMDQPGGNGFAGKTLLALCQNAQNVSAPVWDRFYESLEVDGAHRGALPFRVWQIYRDLVEFVKQGEIAKFVCAAGILAHFIGDACQPLHVSHLHHGRKDHPEEKRVHSVYEEDMLSRRATDMIAGINLRLQGKTSSADVQGGHAAAVSVVELMRATIGRLPPMDIIEAFNEEAGRQRIPHMWNQVGERTMDCMSEGCLRLAALWSSAWKEGGGSAIPAGEVGAVDKDVLMDLYNDKQNFLPAHSLQELPDHGVGIPPGAPPP